MGSFLNDRLVYCSNREHTALRSNRIENRLGVFDASVLRLLTLFYKGDYAMIDKDKFEWIKVAEHSSNYSTTTMEEYVDSTGRYCKQVWNDGYEEVFEIAE
jgi:hypothetical protein